MKKISARAAAHQALMRIETQGAYSDIVLSHLLDGSSLDERDRAFAGELVRGVVRWQKYLDWIIGRLFKGDLRKMPVDVRLLLRQAFYQIIFLKTPGFAAVNECIGLLKERRQFAWSGVANGILRTYLRAPAAVSLPAEASTVEHLAVKTSHPEWLVARWVDQFGAEQTAALCAANNVTPPLSLRVNSRKLSLADFCGLLEKSAIAFERSPVNGFIRVSSMNGQVRQWLNRGLVTVQDESAGLVGLLCASAEGRVLVDLCAAPGGKSTHLAELAPSSVVLSSDVRPRRVNLIVAAKKRLGLSNLQPLVADAAFFPAKSADLVLLDAPCSGLGVLRRKPEIRWKRQERDIEELAQLQRRLIRRAGELVAVGGFLIYSTCTTEREENEAVIDSLLADTTFEVIPPDERIPSALVTAAGMIRTFPHLHGMDGAFAVKLKKKS